MSEIVTSDRPQRTAEHQARGDQARAFVRLLERWRDDDSECDCAHDDEECCAVQGAGGCTRCFASRALDAWAIATGSTDQPVAAEAGEPPIDVPPTEPVLEMLEQVRDQLDDLNTLAQALLDEQRRTNDHLRRVVSAFGQ